LSALYAQTPSRDPRSLVAPEVVRFERVSVNDGEKLVTVGNSKLRYLLSCNPKAAGCMVPVSDRNYLLFNRNTFWKMSGAEVPTVERSLQLMMRYPSDQLTLEIQGGEPLLAFDRIRSVVARAKELAAHAGKTVDIVITSSLSEASNEVLHYCRDEQIKLSTSLDGPAFIHNANRPHPSNNSHALTIQNIARARDIIGTENVAAVMTTTRLSLDHPKEIVDEYVKEGFRSIFLRPISPYGFAVKSRGKTGYEMDRFVRFYKTALESSGY
jgi:hypothetical protein